MALSTTTLVVPDPPTVVPPRGLPAVFPVWPEPLVRGMVYPETDPD